MRLADGKITSITHNADKSVTVVATMTTGEKCRGSMQGGSMTFNVNDAQNFEQQVGGVNDKFTMVIVKGQ